MFVYHEIDRGDDLTTYPYGTARIPLYEFKINGGEIIYISLALPVIPYAKDIKESIENGKVKAKIATYASEDILKGTIEERLTRLGFKSGVITFAGESYGSASYTDTENNGIYRQGNYVFCRIKIENKNIKLQENIFGVIPETFRPKKETYFTICATSDNFNYGGLLCRVEPSGYVAQINSFGDNNWLTFGLNNTYIEFGYEAQPIE